MSSPTSPSTPKPHTRKSYIRTSLPKIAKSIDHSLLHPALTPAAIRSGLHLALKHSVAAVCVPGSAVKLAHSVLFGSPVAIAAVVGFPQGTSSTDVKVFEATQALRDGATEIDAVVNVGRVLGGDWDYVEREIQKLNQAVTGTTGGVLKVIFENGFLKREHIIRLCEICVRVGVEYVKTGTGFGFAKRDGEDGGFEAKGATADDVALMVECCKGSWTKVKAAGGIRNFDDFVRVTAAGAERVGASATDSIIREARSRGIGNQLAIVDVKWDNELKKE
ncbi:MAG: hypothetical protein M1834_002078 [Cirrosporium novae-zelandiae]|nr:MAG: hypothetical protein M1834_002078 [Cirrosporium novae-zelandiae]